MTNALDPATQAPQRAGRREWIGLAVLALACLLYVMDLTVLHLAVPAISEDLQPDERAAALDHRHLRLHGRGLPRHDGDPRRPHRAPEAAADRRGGVRRGVDPCRVLDERGDAHRQPGTARHRRRHPRAIDPVADLRDVPGPRSAHARGRGVDLGLLRRRRDRTHSRRDHARAVLVGLRYSSSPCR